MKLRHKRLLLPSVLLLICIVGIYFLWPKKISPPKLRSKEIKSQLPVDAGLVMKTDELIVNNRYGRFVMKKQGDKWSLEYPVKSRANEKLINSVLRRLGGLKLGQVVTSDPGTFKKYRITKKLAVSLTFKKSGKLLKTLLFGSSGKYTLIREIDKNEVWNHKGALRQSLVRDTRGWISPFLIPYKLKDIKVVTYADKNGKPIYSFKKGKGAAFKPVSGNIPKDFYPGRVTLSVARLLRLRIKNVNNDSGNKNSYFKNAKGMIIFDINGGKKLKLTLGKIDGDFMNIKSSEYNWIPVVNSVKISRTFLDKPLMLISHVVMKLKRKDVKNIEGSCGGFNFKMGKLKSGNFKALGEKPGFAPAKGRVDAFFEYMERGRIQTDRILYAKDVKVDTGFDKKPDFMIFELENGKKVKLTFGKQIKSDFRGFHWRYTINSEKPDYIYLLEIGKILKVCRSKIEWQLPSDDMETKPNAKIFKY